MVNMEDLEHIRAVKSVYEVELMSKANVVGVGIGLRQAGGRSTGEAVIVVSVSTKVPGSQLTREDMIPRELDGVPVDVQVVGDLRAFGA
jgi:hypothetical protein